MSFSYLNSLDFEVVGRNFKPITLSFLLFLIHWLYLSILGLTFLIFSIFRVSAKLVEISFPTKKLEESNVKSRPLTTRRTASGGVIPSPTSSRHFQSHSINVDLSEKRSIESRIANAAVTAKLRNVRRRRFTESDLHSRTSQTERTSRKRHSKSLLIDLHGMTRIEATLQVFKALEEAELKKVGRLKLIVGRGLHSFKGTTMLKPAIMALLERENIDYEIDPGNEGMLIVDLD